jgi:hypothetical protein
VQLNSVKKYTPLADIFSGNSLFLYFGGNSEVAMGGGARSAPFGVLMSQKRRVRAACTKGPFVEHFLQKRHLHIEWELSIQLSDFCQHESNIKLFRSFSKIENARVENRYKVFVN